MTDGAEPTESDYREQLRRGFARLRFEPELESRFRRFYRKYCLTHVRFGLGIGLPLLLIAAWLNRGLFVPRGGPALTFSLMALGIAVLGMALLLYGFARDREGRQLPELMGGALVLGAGLHLLTRCMFAENQLRYPYDTESYALVLIFLLSGLRTLPAVLVALVWVGQLLLFNTLYPQPPDELARLLYTTLSIGLLAGGAGYAQEYVARANFLLSRLNRHRSEHDALTGILNRRGFNERFDDLLRQARRDQTPFALLLLDVDYFKKYNDCYGHPAGDRALAAVAQSLRRHAARRGFDFVARLGGEEFAVVWYDLTPPAAARLAEQVRARIEKLALEHADSPHRQVTVSGGCIWLVPDQETLGDDVIAAADEALYASKHAGRNRVKSVRWSGPVLVPGTA